MLCGGSSLLWPVLTVSAQPVDTCQHTVDMNAPRTTRDSGLSVSHIAIQSLSFLVCVWCSRTWNWQLSLALEESGVGVDELVRLDIAN